MRYAILAIMLAASAAAQNLTIAVGDSFYFSWRRGGYVDSVFTPYPAGVMYNVQEADSAGNQMRLINAGADTLLRLAAQPGTRVYRVQAEKESGRRSLWSESRSVLGSAQVAPVNGIEAYYADAKQIPLEWEISGIWLPATDTSPLIIWGQLQPSVMTDVVSIGTDGLYRFDLGLHTWYAGSTSLVLQPVWRSSDQQEVVLLPDDRRVQFDLHLSVGLYRLEIWSSQAQEWRYIRFELADLEPFPAPAGTRVWK